MFISFVPKHNWYDDVPKKNAFEVDGNDESPNFAIIPRLRRRLVDATLERVPHFWYRSVPMSTDASSLGNEHQPCDVGLRMAAPKRPYLGESAKDRVGARRRKLLDVAFDLMASGVWQEGSIDQICQAAKLNKRYFYESFADVDALAAAVVGELASELVQRGLRSAAEAGVRGFDTETLARHTLSAVVGYLLDDKRRAHVLFREVANTPSAIAHRRVTIHGLSVALSQYGHKHHGARSSDPIADLASALLIGGSIESVLDWLDGKIDMTREQLIDDLAALWVMVGDGAAARAKGRVKGKAARSP